MFYFEALGPESGGTQARPERRRGVLLLLQHSSPTYGVSFCPIWVATGRPIHDCMRGSMYHKAFKPNTYTLPGWGAAVGWFECRSALSRFAMVLPCCQGIHTSCNKWLPLPRARVAPHTVLYPYLEAFCFHVELATKRDRGVLPSLDFSSTSIPSS